MPGRWFITLVLALGCLGGSTAVAVADAGNGLAPPPPPEPTLPSLSILDAVKREPDRGTKMMRFTLALSETAASPMVVVFATEDGTARAPKDFKAATGTLSFTPGALTQVIQVAVRGDTLDERNERFSVVLLGAVGARVADDAATGKILNDD